MDGITMISFVTCIKLMGVYTHFDDLLRRYLDCLQQCSLPYEVIVVEDVDGRNVRFVDFSREYLESRKARVIRYEATYANPYNYNMIEAYTKNVGLREAKYPFVCITNCDIYFKEDFFLWLPSIKEKKFYRFLQFDETKCLNPELMTADKDINTFLHKIAYKSGDIMLMDKETWLEVGGFPETTVWVHSDSIVCTVVLNRRITVQVSSARVFTSSHDHDPTLDAGNFVSIVTPYLNAFRTNP